MKIFGKLFGDGLRSLLQQLGWLLRRLRLALGAGQQTGWPVWPAWLLRLPAAYSRTGAKRRRGGWPALLSKLANGGNTSQWLANGGSPSVP